MKLDIGGGAYPRGNGFLNVDMLPTADVMCDLNAIPWPFEDESVDEVYSSHCIEHVQYFTEFVKEIARICKVGAKVEIRCPDALGEMAMCPSHTSVISIDCMRHMAEVFVANHWRGTKRRLKFDYEHRFGPVEPGCDDHWFPKARAEINQLTGRPLFEGWTDLQLMTWLPRTRHENRFHFVVVETEACYQ